MNLEDLPVRILKEINSASRMTEACERTISLIKEATGLEAVGIRLREGIDYPYYVTKGFPDYFVEAERFLCAYDQSGAVLRDAEGSPYLECMCGNVIRGRTNPSLPFFTPFGSFWSNGTTELLKETTEEDRQARTRNRCNGEGYESVALIPLKCRETIIGLLQLNDKRTGRFRPDMVRQFEELGNAIGIIFAQKQAENELKSVNETLKDRVRELNCLYNLSLFTDSHSRGQIGLEELLAKIASDIRNVWENPKAIHAKISMLKQTYFSEDFIETPIFESVPIYMNDKPAGTITVYLNDNLIIRDGRHALQKKLFFLNLLAKRIGNIIERIRAEKSLSEKTVLVREVNHRIKNNLFILHSIIALQLDRLDEGDAKKIIREIDNRVHSITMLHELLYRSVEQDSVNAYGYISSILSYLKDSWAGKDTRIRIKIDIPEDVLLGVDKVLPVGLIINEGVTNSYKYAFKDRAEGTITVALNREADRYVLRIADDGIGLPADFNPEAASSLGLNLIRALTTQLDGKLDITVDCGTQLGIGFP